MRFLTKLTYVGSGLGILGAAWLWVAALTSGFSSSNVVCYGGSAGSCTLSGSPYWRASTVLWLSPLAIILIALAWFLPMYSLPKKTHPIIGALIVLGELAFLAYFLLSFAVGNRL